MSPEIRDAAGVPLAPAQLVEPQHLRVQVLSVRPHDVSAFTQGLLLYRDELYESTGEYGRSTLRRVDPATGTVRQRIDVDPQYFAEGLARVGDQLVQLTWREGTAFVYDRASFVETDAFGYAGEGWGLCFDGRRLVMSDGSDRLTFRDPDTFEIQGQQQVTQAGVPLARLNELECVGDQVYANVWTTDEIVRIDPASGAVTAVIDASGLLTEDERLRADVLNGIAWDPETGHFLITGKWWPWLFEVRFVAAILHLPLVLDAEPPG